MSSIPQSEWKWFGHAGHLIVSQWCRFHLCTLIGRYLVSTVGEYVPDETVREIHCEVRGIALVGRGDARLADYMKKVGFQEIGFGRTYETMVFNTTGEFCQRPECGCGLPAIVPTELEGAGYSNPGDATRGHYAACEKWAEIEVVPA